MPSARDIAIVLAATSASLGSLASAAVAAPYSGLKHTCSYRFGVGSYQSISYDGQTSCAEARGPIMNLTADGRRAPKTGKRTGHTPHGTWACTTIRRREVHGVIESTHSTTCRLTDDPRGRPARVRFFYEN